MNDESVDDDVEPVSSDDVAFLNREAMRDLAVWGRVVGMAVIIAGGIGAAAWLWITIRTQQHVDTRGFTFAGGDNSGQSTFARRLDAFASTIGLLVSSALTLGLGVVVLLISNHLTMANGGTLSGFQEGDPFPRSKEIAPSND